MSNYTHSSLYSLVDDVPIHGDNMYKSLSFVYMCSYWNTYWSIERYVVVHMYMFGCITRCPITIRSPFCSVQNIKCWTNKYTHTDKKHYWVAVYIAGGSVYVYRAGITCSYKKGYTRLKYLHYHLSAYFSRMQGSADLSVNQNKSRIN